MIPFEGDYAVKHTDAETMLRTLRPGEVNLVIGSPPYPLKGKRYAGADQPSRLDVPQWIDLMVRVTTEAVRVASGDVVWIVNNPVKDGRYVPAVEGLIWTLHTLGRGIDRPVIWHKNSPPNRLDWFGNDWEYVLCFTKGEKRKTWNWQSVATAPKHDSGGRFRQRTANGERRLGSEYPKNKLTRPRDVIRVPVGGGMMGFGKADSAEATNNEAPFPPGIVSPFIETLTNPGDVVCDPFCGSGTTLIQALKLGRKAIGCDIRASEVVRTKQRIEAAIAAAA